MVGIVSVPCPQPAPLAAAPSPGEFSGGSPIDLMALRRCFPDRWGAFLRAHFRDHVHVAYFFGVNEKTARNWWGGIGAPRGEVVLAVVARCPSAVAVLMPVAA